MTRTMLHKNGDKAMTNYELMNKIIRCKSKKDIVRLLNKYRVSTNKSKYCQENNKMDNELRIIIAGSRNFNDYEFLKREVLNIVKYDNRPKEYVKIISGCARGADTLGERFAKEFGLEVKKFPADWDGLGKRAGYVRNAEMAKFAVEDNSYGVLIAFWDGQSRGTKHMIDLAKRYGLEVHVVNYKENNANAKITEQYITEVFR